MARRTKTKTAATVAAAPAVVDEVVVARPDPPTAEAIAASRARRKRALLDEIRATGHTPAITEELAALEDVPILSHHELQRLG